MSRVFLGILLVGLCVIGDSARAHERDGEAALRAASRTPVTSRIDGKVGTPQLIRGNFPFSAALEKREVAQQFLERHRVYLGVPASHDFEIRRVFADGDNTVVRVSQSLNGVPIFGSDVAININADNEVRVVSGRFHSAVFDTTPSFDRDAAIAAAEHAVGNPVLTEAPTARLEGYARQEFGALVWHVVLDATDSRGAPARWSCFIDAHDGHLIERFDEVRHLLDRRIYDLQGSSNFSDAILTLSEGGTTKDKVAQATHDNVGTVYDYFLNTHGRDSMNGAGGPIQIFLHRGGNPNYTAFAPLGGLPSIVFGDGDLHSAIPTLPYGTALDVVAHEYTHGVTHFTAQLGGTEQSRTLNESMSDVFAMLIDSDDFLLGEDLFKGQFRALESMASPRTYAGQPEHMSDYRLDAPIPALDQHMNAGITNKAFYNIATAIGRPDTGRIYYRALTIYMTSSTEFVGARLALEQAALDLFGPGSPQLAAVQDGFSAVGIVQPPDDFAGAFVADARVPVVDAKGAVTMTFTHPGARAMKLVFGVYRFPGRTVYIQDAQGTVIYDYRSVPVPLGGGFTTGPVHGDTITVTFYPPEVGGPLVVGGWPTVTGYVHGNLDFEPPVASAISVGEVGHFGATLRWTTDEPANTQVEYGGLIAYGTSSPMKSFRTLEHRVDLNALRPGSTYHLRARSRDSAGNEFVSGDVSFDTPPATDTVTITRAQWPGGTGLLRLEAEASDPNAILKAYFRDDFLIGTLDGDGKGGYRLRLGTFFNPGHTDETVEVRSSGGGLDSWFFPAEFPLP